MVINSIKTLPKLIWNSLLQTIVLAVLVGFLFCYVYGFVYHYQQQRMHVQQLAELLARSASNVDGANLVASQVGVLLNEDYSIQNIVFYSTDHPISSLDELDVEQNSNDWYTALFTDAISFNRAVTSGYASKSNTQASNVNLPLSTPAANRGSSVEKANNPLDRASVNTNTLVGYINITLDINKLRMQWLRKTILLWLLTLTLVVTAIGFIFRKLLRTTEDLGQIANVCNLLVNDPNLEQLPVIQQRFEFREFIHIKQAFILLFERLRQMQREHEALGDFEQQLHHKERSLEVQRNNFQSMITHELKTSLNAISGGLQLLDKHYLSYDQQDTLEIIRNGSEHLESTLEQIIQLNKIEKGQIVVTLVVFNPLLMIADLLAEFDPIAQQKGIELLSHIHHIDYNLEGDANKIKQILTAVIDNAIKFTQKGRVTIESQLTHFNNSIRWQLKISDTGIGINANYIEDIFTPFFQIDSSRTRKYEGVGVGLPVIKQLLQLIDASIEVDSELDKGSQFVITIPLRNKYKSWQHTLLKDLEIIYYYADENDLLVKELQGLGATVISRKYEQLMLGNLDDIKVDMVMFAEDILPEKVAQLARLIRGAETSHRALLIYWCPSHNKYDLYDIEHELKVAGIDYCEGATQNTQRLIKILKTWIGRT